MKRQREIADTQLDLATLCIQSLSTVLPNKNKRRETEDKRKKEKEKRTNAKRNRE